MTGCFCIYSNEALMVSTEVVETVSQGVTMPSIGEEGGGGIVTLKPSVKCCTLVDAEAASHPAFNHQYATLMSPNKG